MGTEPRLVPITGDSLSNSKPVRDEVETLPWL